MLILLTDLFVNGASCTLSLMENTRRNNVLKIGKLRRKPTLVI